MDIKKINEISIEKYASNGQTKNHLSIHYLNSIGISQTYHCFGFYEQISGKINLLIKKGLINEGVACKLLKAAKRSHASLDSLVA